MNYTAIPIIVYIPTTEVKDFEIPEAHEAIEAIRRISTCQVRIAEDLTNGYAEENEENDLPCDMLAVCKPI